jgi:homoserine kinase
VLPNILKLITTLLALVSLRVAYTKVVRPRLQAWKQQRLASKKYAALTSGSGPGTCYLCGQAGADHYDSLSARWYCVRCAKSLTA